MKLTPQLKEACGYDWVMARLEPVSPFGRALARNPRWYGPGEEGDLDRELDRVAAALTLSPEQRDSTVHILSAFHDIRGCLSRPDDSPMDEVELFEVKHFLLCLNRLASKAPQMDGLTLSPLTGLLDLLDPSGRRLPPFSVETAFDPALAPVREEKKAVEQELRSAQGTARDGLLVRRQALVQEEDRLEFSVRRALTAALLAEKDALIAAMDTIGRLDLVLAKAKLAQKHHCARPNVTCAAPLTLTNMVHPQVAARLEERSLSFTPIYLELERGSTVITGANMGGKSVSLKTVTLNLLLMQTGFFVFSEAMTSPLFHTVCLICADEQSLDRGLSSFGAEITALDQVLRQEKDFMFFLALDEFARGTNPREGAALAKALTQRLNRADLNCTALLTTHYDGVSDAARRHYQVAGLKDASRSTLSDLPKLMDYRLIPAPPGAPCPRDALKVCRLLDLEGELTKLFAENI